MHQFLGGRGGPDIIGGRIGMAPIMGPIGPMGPPIGGPIGGRIPEIERQHSDTIYFYSDNMSFWFPVICSWC